MRFRRVATIIVFAAPLAAVVLIAVGLVRVYLRRSEQDLRPILEQELTRALGHEVRVGKIEIGSGLARIDDVRIAEGKRLSDSGPIVRAKAVEVDVDLRRILLSRDKKLPLFAHIRVIEPVAYARRDAQGRWNFEDHFRPSDEPPTRPGVGTVNIVGGTLHYDDYALSHHEKRPQSRVSARLEGVTGALLFYVNRGATWTFSVTGSQIMGPSTVSGSYDPLQSSLLLKVDATGVKLPVLTRYLPPDSAFAAGTLSGSLTVVRSLDTAGDARFDYQSNLQIANGAFQTKSLAETVSAVRGSVTVAGDLATFQADGSLAGSPIHTEGTVLGFSEPWLQGWAQGSGLHLGRTLSALKIDDRVPGLRDISATASLRADFRGPLSAPSITASGPVRLAGKIPGGARISETAALQVAMSGTLTKPALHVSGTLPLVTYKGYSARDVRLSAAYSSKPGAEITVDLNGSIGGGSAAARAALKAGAEDYSYRANIRVRDVDLTKLPLRPVNGDRPAGKVSADIAVDGTTRKGSYPRGTARVRASALTLGARSLSFVDASVRSDGSRLYAEPVIASDRKGFAAVTGSVGYKDGALDLRADADGLDVAHWQTDLLGPPGGTETNTRGAEAQSAGYSGTAYLRNITIRGTIEEPVAAGRIYGYNLRSERIQEASEDPMPLLDFMVSDFHANRRALTVIDGRAYRFPAVATVSGIVAHPFSPSPRLDLEGSFSQVDVNDISGLAGADLDGAGLAEGSFRLVGVAERPEVIAQDIRVHGLRLAEVDFNQFTAALRFSPYEQGGLWTLENLTAVRARSNAPPEEWTTLTASGTLQSNLHFDGRARLDRLDLSLVEPYVSDYATVTGLGEATIHASGSLRDGYPVDLTGDASIRTRGLTVNRVSIGDLRGIEANAPATVVFREDRFTSNDLRIGDATAGLALKGGGDAAPALTYDRDTLALRVSGEVLSLRIDLLRQALTNSPYVASNPESVAAQWLKPITNPIEGTVGGTFAISGSVDDPVTKVDWAVQGARIERNAIDALSGSVTFTRSRVDVETASLTAGETTFNASGSLVYGKSIAGGIETFNMPLRLAKQWFPGRPYLRDMEGVAESVHISVLGDPANPSLTASLLFRDISWIESVMPGAPDDAQPVAQPAVQPAASLPPRGTGAPVELSPGSRMRVVDRLDTAGRAYSTTTTGRELWISSLDTSTITVNSPQSPNQIRADDIHVTLREPDALPSGSQADRTPLKAPREFKVYARGEAAFDWLNMDVLKDPDVRFEVNVPQQQANALLALIPRFDASEQRPDDVVGTVRAQLLWTGTIQKPDIRGSIEASADRIHFANRTTQVRNLDAHLDFTGDAVDIRRFTAFTEIIDPRSKQVLRTSDAIRVTGSIGLAERSAGGPVISIWPPRISSGSALLVRADHLKFAETAIPGWQAGRVVTDDTAVDLRITGSLLRPHISGTVDVRTADLRLPEQFLDQPERREPIFQPSFDLRIRLGDKVRVVASPLSAVVRTSANEPISLRGDLIGGDVTRLNLAGTLLVNSGTLAFPTARFALQPGGRVALRYPFRTFAIEKGEPILLMNVDVRAVTRMTAPPANNPSRLKRYTISVEAKGPLNSGAPIRYQDQTGFAGFLDQGLKLTFRSDPPDLAANEADLRRKVTARLGGEGAIQGLFTGGSSVGRVVRQQVTDILSESFIPGLLEPLVGSSFEEFTLDVSQLSAFTLRVSRQLFGPVYLGYWQRLSGSSQTVPGEDAFWQFKLSYRFRPQLQISFTTDDQRTNAYLLEGVFRF